MKSIIITISVVIFSILLVGCVKTASKSTNVKSNTIKTSWKCLGFANTSDNIIQDINPINNKEAYTLHLKKDNTFDGVTSFNTIHGDYTVDTAKQGISLTIKMSTRAMETPDGNQYMKAIKGVTNYQFSSNGNLKLFYTSKDYLVFKKI